MLELLNSLRANVLITSGISVVVGIVLWMILHWIFCSKRPRQRVAEVEPTRLPTGQQICEQDPSTSNWVPVSPQPTNAVVLEPGQHVTRVGNTMALLLSWLVAALVGLIVFGVLKHSFVTGVDGLDAFLAFLSKSWVAVSISLLAALCAWLMVWTPFQVGNWVRGNQTPLPAGQQVRTFVSGSWSAVSPQPTVVLLEENQFVAEMQSYDPSPVVKLVCALAAFTFGLGIWAAMQPDMSDYNNAIPTTDLSKKVYVFLRNAQLAERSVYRKSVFKPGWNKDEWHFTLDKKHLETMKFYDGSVKDLAENLKDKGVDPDIEIVEIHSMMFVGDTQTGKLKFVRIMYDATLAEKVDKKTGAKERLAQEFRNKPFGYVPSKDVALKDIGTFVDKGNDYLIQNILPKNGGFNGSQAFLNKLPEWPAIMP